VFRAFAALLADLPNALVMIPAAVISGVRVQFFPFQHSVMNAVFAGLVAVDVSLFDTLLWEHTFPLSS
jgi:hypothetical protein